MAYRTNAKLPRVSLEQVLDFVSTSTPQERERIASLMRSMRAESIAEAKEEFVVGDRVAFTVKRKRFGTLEIVGVIKEIRKKRFLIKPENDPRNWTVPADQVRKVF